MGVRIVLALGLLCASSAVPVRAQDSGNELSDADARELIAKMRKDSERLEKEAAELRRAAEDAMLKNREDAAAWDAAVALARASGRPVIAPVDARVPLDPGAFEAGFVLRIAKKSCLMPVQDVSQDLAIVDWAQFQRVKDVQPYMAGLTPCQERVFQRLADRGRAWKPGTVIGPDALLPPTR